MIRNTLLRALSHPSGKIGEWIEKLGFATEQEVTSALALQWGCPVATSFDPSTVHSAGDIPLPILEAFQMLPFNYFPSTKTLCIAFGERVDHAALYAIEKILDCRTQPCVAGRKIVARQLDAMRQFPRPTDVEFGPMNDLAEMGRIAASYTARLSPEQVRLARIGHFIWLRLDILQTLRQELHRNAITNAASNSTLETRSAAQHGFRFKARGGVASTTNLVFRLPADPVTLPWIRPFRHLQPAAPQIG